MAEAKKHEMHRPGRCVPRIPRVGERLPLIIDSDAANEIDDQYAIALAVHAPERLAIEGFVATHFGDRPGSTDESAEEILRVLTHCGLEGKWPVMMGGGPLQYSSVPTESEGAEFIIERAMAHSAQEPLWIAVLGACTNVVSAYLKCPEMAERVVVLFHGRTQFWPERCYNFNIVNDVKAARVLFASRLPLVLFDTGTYLYVSMEETEARLASCGKIGKYLHEIRRRREEYASPKKALFDLGDIAFLMDPAICEYEEAAAPWLDWDLRYLWEGDYGRIVRVYQIQRGRTFEIFYDRLNASA